MAVAVSHAMRRYPVTPPDTSYTAFGLRSDSGCPNPGSAWQTLDDCNGGSSALSRSMRYAEPWLYGSVRAAPGGLVLAPALVLCSCPEYTSGTKRSSKKGPTTCKKCKGTRLPLAGQPGGGGTLKPKFGTVRGTSNHQPPQNINGALRAGTVRVTSSTSRPSILPSVDPYDLMRRSRLGVSCTQESQFRARSISPSKARLGDNRTMSAGRLNSVSPSSSNGGYMTLGGLGVNDGLRKSILECDVNPYELMTTDNGRQEASITAINGQRIRVRATDGMGAYEEVHVKKQASPASQSHIPKLLQGNKLPGGKSGGGGSVRGLTNSRTSSEAVTNPFIYTNANGNTSNCSTNVRTDENESYPSTALNDGFNGGIVSNGHVSSEAARFKSILKKPSTTFSDTDSNDCPERRSPSPVVRRSTSGSHFYLPMPVPTVTATPRKKVQFLVENELADTSPTGVSTEEAPEEVQEPGAVSTSLWYAEDVDIATPDQVQHGEDLWQQSSGDRSHKEMGAGDYETRGVAEEMKNQETAAEQRGPCTLRRSLSDRVAQVGASVVFHDTMALRIKNNRGDSRSAFSTVTDLQRLDGVGPSKTRPRDPPPPPPRNSIDSGTPHPIVPTRTAPPAPRTAPNAGPRKETEPPSLVPPSAPPRKRSNSKQPTVQILSNPTTTPTAQSSPSLDDAAKVAKVVKRKSVNFAVENDIKAQTKKTNKAPVQMSERSSKIFQESPGSTVVQISTPPSNTVHRLQIKNEFVETVNVRTVAVENEPQRKTSIMINGDDCYSTVNVSDDVQIYQSSVVVNDSGAISPVVTTGRSSSVYITGSFVNATPTTQKSVTAITSTDEHNTQHQMIDSNPRLESPSNTLGNRTLVMLDDSSDSHSRSNSLVQTTEEKSVTCRPPTETPQERVPLRPAPAVTKQPISERPKIEPPYSTNRTNPSSEELARLLRDPVEAVRRNLVPHVCGKSDVPRRPKDLARRKPLAADSKPSATLVARLLEDPLLESLAEGLETNEVAKMIEDSLLKLRNRETIDDDDKDACSEDSSSTQYETVENGSDCSYGNHSNRSSVTEEELGNRTKFYQLLADAALTEIEDHHYESIRANVDPIYEEIEIPPPLPANPPPSSLVDDLQLDKQFTTRSIFEGASKYDILSYLVDAKERGVVQEDSYTYNFGNAVNVVVEEEEEEDPAVKEAMEAYSSRVSHMSTVSDSSEDSSLVITCPLTGETKTGQQRSAEVERNDSGVGSETSKSSRNRFRTQQPELTLSCEDCEVALENQAENEPLICRKCMKKRSERKEIITEIVETEEKYSRDLQIILEEFYQPMLVAGLLTPEQLGAIFLNVEELLENSQALAERLRDTVEIAVEQGDEDLLTVNIGKIFLEAAPMLHAFETYCVRQGAASLLLASLEKDKELLRIFLRVSQMENTMLRRMNLNSFLMVPVQRVTKYPLLLARLHKVTPAQHETREGLKESQHKIELHLSHMNSETRDVPSKLWRRISSGSGRRSSSEMDLVNIKLRKIAVDVLEWNHDEARFALEGKLLFTQPTDNNWRKGRTIKLTPINALLVTNGKPTANHRPERADEDGLAFPRHSGVREAALLLVRDKGGRYSLLREPLYLDRCVVAADPAWHCYFEVQELLGKDTFIFKAEDSDMTRTWYRQLQYHAQGMGAWRKRRNALANIMINGMGSRA